MMHLSLMFDARARQGPGSRSRGKTPSKSMIARIRRAQKRLAELGEVDVLTAGDNDVCPVCEAISEDGPYSLDTAEDLIPAHPYAVLEGSSIASYGSMYEMVRARFVGPAVYLRTSAKVIAIGPQHPMFTRRGWLKAYQITEGDELLYDSRVDLAAIAGGRSHFKHMPMVEDVFETTTAISPTVTTGAAHDLHGDRIFCQGKIDVVLPTRDLLPVLDPRGIEHFRKDNFVRPNVRAALMAALRAGNERLASTLAATVGFMRGGNLSLALAGRHALPFDTLLFALGSQSDVGSREHSRNDTATRLEFTRQGHYALASEIGGDHSSFRWNRVLEVHIRQFSGWAFDGSTASGLYNSDGYVVKNCRCAFVPAGTLEDALPSGWIKDFNPYHAPAGSPEGGQFTSAEGSSAGGGIESLVHISADPPFDPKVVDVGGDDWNRQTALRLEREYQQAKPEMEKLANAAVEGKVQTMSSQFEVVPHPSGHGFALQSAKGYASYLAGGSEVHFSTKEEAEANIEKFANPPDDEEEAEQAEYIPESWDEINNTKQEEIKNDWMEKTADEFLQSEIQSWQENGDAMDDTKGTLAYYLENHKGHENNQYALDALNELRDERKEEREHEIPFTNEQLMDAMSFDYQTGYGGDKDVDITWHEDKLGLPKGWVSEQGTLPGIEPIQPSSKLTKEMREAIETKLIKAFNDEADNKVGDAEPPEYLNDNVGEYQDMSWDSMSDKSKFKWAKENGHIESQDDEEPKQITLNKMPDKIDPLGERDKTRDYQLTKLLAEKISIGRAADLMVQRGVFKDRNIAVRAAHDFDNRIWRGWKQDSGSADGLILQAATAAELGGRFRSPMTGKSTIGAGYEQQANERFGSAGGWDGVKAYVRAKWETSQYLLDKANKPEVDLYRGILIKDKGREEEAEVKRSADWSTAYTRLPDIVLHRNGAQSTTTDQRVANEWKGIGAAAKGLGPKDRVVLRMRVPRTAVLSLPAYGQNVYGEHEVVLAGTAWKKWDAWKGQAPSFVESP